MLYAVIEQAGYEGERTAKTFQAYSTAVKWLDRTYSAAEIESLHVAIAVELDDGSRSYEIH
jgi:hypothetical protein